VSFLCGVGRECCVFVSTFANFLPVSLDWARVVVSVLPFF
jgi:hypothetical protein